MRASLRASLSKMCYVKHKPPKVPHLCLQRSPVHLLFGKTA
uniref:Uncharacterized protein n=1 Tax=Anguilla anguilla TaxID=7936 RepID=A0A0E9PCF1_ANGAN